MITKQQAEEHHIALEMNCNPKSPFFGMIDMASDGGLLTLSVEDQKVVYAGMSPKLKAMVDTFMDEQRQRQGAAV